MKAKSAIVIGAGFGGLAAAARLSARGYGVIILEGTDQPGGRASVFTRGGHVFDAGPTVITAPYLLDELFTLLGKRARDYFELRPIDPFYRVHFADQTTFDYVGDEDRLLANIAKINPADCEGYRRLAERARDIFDVGYTQLADQPFLSPGDMIRIIPRMLALGNYRSVYGLVSKFIKDERLRQAFSFEPLLVGGNPMTVTSIYLLIHWLERKWGVHFAMGGTGAIVAGLVRALEERGVNIRYNAPVEHLGVEGGSITSIRTAGGTTHRADLVVANADPIRVYAMMDERHRPRHRDRKLRSFKASMGLFVLYFGTDRTYPEVAHHTILLGPRYGGLLKDIFTHRRLAPDFSLYLHAPTRTDPSLAPPGHDTFYVLSPVPNTLAGIDWEVEGPRYAEKILASLEGTVLPGLRRHLTVKFHHAPDYFESQMRSTHGAGFGLEPRLTQSAYFRIHNKSPDIDNLYFVGASTHPGAGVPGVLSSAKVLERVLPT